jgi:hypothetical protein
MRESRRPASTGRGPHRERRGRGLRGELAPRVVPRNRTRGEQFDELVLDAVEELEGRWAAELTGVEFAVEDVPSVTAGRVLDFDPEVIVDRGVPLGRLVRTGTASNGTAATGTAGVGTADVGAASAGAASTSAAGSGAATIIVYRRPVETRAPVGDDRADLVFMVVAELVAELLGRDVDEIDPP